MTRTEPFEDEVLATRFKDFCGEERNRKFLDKLNTTCREKGRLLFWQQDIWDAFVLVYPEYAPISFDYLAAPIVSCPVHHCLFEPDSVRIVYGLVRYTSEYREARNTLFPYANACILGGCDEVEDETESDVLYCSQCRREEQLWQQEQLVRASAGGTQ